MTNRTWLPKASVVILENTKKYTHPRQHVREIVNNSWLPGATLKAIHEWQEWITMYQNLWVKVKNVLQIIYINIIPDFFFLYILWFPGPYQQFLISLIKTKSTKCSQRNQHGKLALFWIHHFSLLSRLVHAHCHIFFNIQETGPYTLYPIYHFSQYSRLASSQSPHTQYLLPLFSPCIYFHISSIYILYCSSYWILKIHL